ncbi:MAG: kynureninase [Cytophagales bacterium]|nr:kynureninase [Cytophagales bacterium]
MEYKNISRKEKFSRPANCDIYFCGHSLGLQPKASNIYIQKFMQDWSNYAVKGHFEEDVDWYNYHTRLTPALAHLCGAQQDEVVAMNSLTVNLHLALQAFYVPGTNIIAELLSFSSNHYAVMSILKKYNIDAQKYMVEIPADKDYTLSTTHILSYIEKYHKNTSVLLLSAINYVSGQYYDLKTIAESCKTHGIIFGLDLAHAIGNVPLHLHDLEVDFAVWCSYKYLNSGPGGVGGFFIHQKHHTNTHFPSLAGWWGHNADTRFAMSKDFDPMRGAQGWQLSNAPIAAMTIQYAALEIFMQVGIQPLRTLSIALTTNLAEGIISIINKYNLTNTHIITPLQPEARGAMLSIKAIGYANKLYSYLTSKNIIIDLRKPDIIRITPAPLYNSFDEVDMFLTILDKFYADNNHK